MLITSSKSGTQYVPAPPTLLSPARHHHCHHHSSPPPPPSALPVFSPASAPTCPGSQPDHRSAFSQASQHGPSPPARPPFHPQPRRVPFATGFLTKFPKSKGASKPSHQKCPSCTTFNPPPNAYAIHNAPQKTVLFHVITINLSSAFASTTTSTSYPGCIVYFSVSRHVIGARRVGRHDATPLVQHLRSHLEAANAAIATFDSHPVAHLLSSPRRQYHGRHSVLDANATHRSIIVWLPSRSSSALPMQTTSARPTC